MATYEEHLPGLYPTFLRGVWGHAWGAAEGAAYDAVLTAAKAAAKVGFVLVAPASALSYLSVDVGVERAPGEDNDSWRARIAGAWESWSWVGTRYGITLSVGLLGYGYPTVWSYRELPPDDDAARWARVLVYFRGLPAWDAGATWDGDDEWDSDRSVDAIETADPMVVRPQLRRVLRQWINARDVVDRVVIASGGLLWDVDALWDGDDVWDAGDAGDEWDAPEWDTDEDGAVWDSPAMAWDAFC
ncbi:MAG: hypothetical protein KA978_26535 [Deltaproteobacteria bacterium]|nr:hypothetical protein [Deltaproteobacteria bacterium]